VRVSQKSNQHSQEEHCIDHENDYSIEEDVARMLYYAGVRGGVVCSIDLFWVSISVSLYYLRRERWHLSTTSPILSRLRGAEDVR
jgi:hypothetical protein